MIKITRPALAPAVLINTKKRDEHEAEYQAAPADYHSGDKTFTFDKRVYADPSVKKALIDMQNEKCAFCESKPLAVSSGDVEHYRPKARVRSVAGGQFERPGYYWLAYDWHNLLFSCEQCNRRQKRNEFPLATPRSTPRNHMNGVAGEQPMFIDPSTDDPAAHIGFRKHMPFALTPEGQATINGLGLGRSELAKDREEHFNRLRDTFVLAEVIDDHRFKPKALVDLERALSEKAEYAAMNRAAVAAWRAQLAAKQPLGEP